MRAYIFKVPFGNFIVYWYDDLLLGRTFCGHVEMRFQFTVVPIDDFLDLINFLIQKIWECFLDFQDIHCNIG